MAAATLNTDALRRVKVARDTERKEYKSRMAHLLHRRHRLRQELNEPAAD